MQRLSFLLSTLVFLAIPATLIAQPYCSIENTTTEFGWGDGDGDGLDERWTWQHDFSQMVPFLEYLEFVNEVWVKVKFVHHSSEEDYDALYYREEGNGGAYNIPDVAKGVANGDTTEVEYTFTDPNSLKRALPSLTSTKYQLYNNAPTVVADPGYVLGIASDDIEDARGHHADDVL